MNTAGDRRPAETPAGDLPATGRCNHVPNVDPPFPLRLWRWNVRCAPALVLRGAAETRDAATHTDLKEVVYAEARDFFVLQTGHQRRTWAMLRITADEKPRVLTFRLEGRLEGPWAAELEKCWRGMLSGASRPTVRVDLTGLTFVDAAGKARLTAMYRKGAEFITADCLTKAIVAEITAGEPPAEGGPSCPEHT